LADPRHVAGGGSDLMSVGVAPLGRHRSNVDEPTGVGSVFLSGGGNVEQSDYRPPRASSGHRHGPAANPTDDDQRLSESELLTARSRRIIDAHQHQLLGIMRLALRLRKILVLPVAV